MSVLFRASLPVGIKIDVGPRNSAPSRRRSASMFPRPFALKRMCVIVRLRPPQSSLARNRHNISPFSLSFRPSRDRGLRPRPGMTSQNLREWYEPD